MSEEDIEVLGEERAFMMRTIELLNDVDCSTAEIVDWIMVRECGYSRREWARERGVKRPVVSHHVRQADQKIEEADLELRHHEYI